MQVHLARLVLQPDVDASPALQTLLRQLPPCSLCQRCTLTMQQAKSSAREAAVVQALRKCLRGSEL